MKRFLLLFYFAFFFCKLGHSQYYVDSIFTKNYDTIVCHITMINSENIFYIVNKKNITFISRRKVDQYVLTSKEAEINTESKGSDSLTINQPSDAFYLKGQSDALRYYDYYNVAGTGTFVISLISPLIGLIPAIASSSTIPKDKWLSYPNSELFKNIDYQNGYRQKARKIKQGRVWTNWGIAFAINVFAVALILSSETQ